MNIDRVCIASWGSYNSCNDSEASLGVWVNLDDFNTFDEIIKHLETNHNFITDGIDEELFIIDDDNNLYPTDDDLSSAWKRFEILKGIDLDILEALAESDNMRNKTLDELKEIDDRYVLYPNYYFDDYATETFNELYLNDVPSHIQNYINYDAFARDLSFEVDYIESSKGLVIINH